MKATLAHLVHDQTLARRDDDAKPNEQASPRLHRGISVRPLLNGVHESIKILYEAGKDIEILYEAGKDIERVINR